MIGEIDCQECLGEISVGKNYNPFQGSVSENSHPEDEDKTLASHKGLYKSVKVLSYCSHGPCPFSSFVLVSSAEENLFGEMH